MIDRPTLLAQIDALASQLSALRSFVVSGGDDDEQLDARQSFERYGVGRDGLLSAERRGEIKLSRGPKNKILVARSELEKLQARPHAPTKPRAPKAKRSNVTSIADWEREAESELRAMGGQK